MACLASIAVAPCPGRIGESVVTALWTRILAGPSRTWRGPPQSPPPAGDGGHEKLPGDRQVPARLRPFKVLACRHPVWPTPYWTFPARSAARGPFPALACRVI